MCPKAMNRSEERYSIMKTFALIASLAAALLIGAGAVPAYAFDDSSNAEVNVDATDLGLRGYDPVSYISDGAPAIGSEDLTASQADVTYRFASEANPAQYVSQYGGFCQMGAALGKKLHGAPNVWRAENGMLFLYAYPAAKDGFLKDVAGNTEKADTNWPLIKDKVPKDL